MMNLVLAVFLLGLAGCGEEEPPPKTTRPVKKGDGLEEPRTAAAPPPVPVPARPPLVLYPKVEERYRKQWKKEDFEPDPTGDVNRDPFRSFLFAPAPQGEGGLARADDVCRDKLVAGELALGELRLVGVLAGHNEGALFVDGKGLGHIAHQGDCLSRDKARVANIAGSSVELELRGEAPPGAPAPPATTQVVRLHPEELDLGKLQSGGGPR